MFNYKESARQSIHVILLIFVGGIFALISSIFLGYIGFAIISFLGLMACSSVIFIIVPFINRGEGDK